MMRLETRSRMGRFGAVLALALLVGAAARAQDVTSNYVPGTDFSKYEAYKNEPSAHRREPHGFGRARRHEQTTEGRHPEFELPAYLALKALLSCAAFSEQDFPGVGNPRVCAFGRAKNMQKPARGSESIVIRARGLESAEYLPAGAG